MAQYRASPEDVVDPGVLRGGVYGTREHAPLHGGKDLPRWRILRTKRQFEKAAAPKAAAFSPFYMHLAGVSRSRQDQMGTRRLQPVSIRW